MIPKLSLFCLAFFFSLSVVAQSENYLKYNERYPDQSVVVLNEERVCRFSIVDDKLQVTEEVTEQYLYLSAAAAKMSKVSLGFSSFSSVEMNEAYSLVPNEKGKLKKQKVNDFKVKDETTSGIFHDDQKSLNFRYAGLKEGAETFLNYTRTHHIDQATSRFFFESSIPQIRSVFKVIVDEGVEVKWEFFHKDRITVDFTETKEKNSTVYTWSLTEAEPGEIPEDAPTFASWSPHIAVRAVAFENDAGRHRVLQDVSDLFAWYNSLLAQVEPYEEGSAELEKQVSELLEGAASEEEKVQRICRWVQDEIKYIAFEDGYGGMIPRSAESVCAKRYGDCKDMAYLMHKMCDIAGIKTYLTWIGTRDIPYDYDEMPTPIVDNHMILTWGDPEAPKWLDATHSTMEFGVPPSGLQGKQALLRISDNEYKVVRVPVMDPNYSRWIERISLSLEDGLVNGSSSLEVRGYYRSAISGQFKYIGDDEENKKQYLTWQLGKGNNKFNLDDIELSHLRSYSDNMRLNHDFSIPDLAVQLDDEIILNMNLYPFDSYDNAAEGRDIPIEYEFKEQIDVLVSLAIPEGYEVDHLPESIHLDNDLFTFKAYYEREGSELMLHHEMRLNNHVIPSEHFDIWNETLNQVREFHRNAVVLKKTID